MLNTNLSDARLVSHFPTNVVTFVFTDIENFSALVRQYQFDAQSLLHKHHQIIRGLLRRWNGLEIRVMGDGFFVVFQRPSDAILFGMNLQSEMRNHEWVIRRSVAYREPAKYIIVEDIKSGESDEEEMEAEVLKAVDVAIDLRVRVGIHTGEATLEFNPSTNQYDYFGDNVNIASRVMSAGDGGQTLISEVTYHMISVQLLSAFTFRDLGNRTLKNIGSCQLFEVNWRQSEGEPPEAPFNSQGKQKLETGYGPLAPKLCNRLAQESVFADFFIEHLRSKPGIPQVYALYGNKDECHHSFVERIIHTQIQEIAQKKWGNRHLATTHLRLPWPNSGNFIYMQRELRRQLIINLAPDYDGEEISAQSIAKLARRFLTPVILIQHNIFAEQWENTPALLSWYLDFWSTIKDVGHSSQNPQFLIFLNVHHPLKTREAPVSKIFKIKRPKKNLMWEKLNEIFEQQGHVCPKCLLPELTSPHKYEVIDWFQRYNFFSVTTQNQFLELLFPLEQEYLCMSDLEHKLAIIHQKYVEKKWAKN